MVVVAVVVVVVVAGSAPTVAACQTPTSLKPSPFTSPRFVSSTNAYSGSPRVGDLDRAVRPPDRARAATRPVGFVPFATSSGCQNERHVLSDADEVPLVLDAQVVQRPAARLTRIVAFSLALCAVLTIGFAAAPAAPARTAERPRAAPRSTQPHASCRCSSGAPFESTPAVRSTTGL